MSNKGFDPRRELANVRDSLNRVFEDAVAYAKGSSYSVPVDMYQTDDNVVVVAGPLYRVIPESLDVSLTGDMLTIQGETEPESEVPIEAYLKRERRAGHFKRTVRIPLAFEGDGIQAQLKDMILKVRLPKVKAEATTDNPD
jgi:HSP20 family protein